MALLVGAAATTGTSASAGGEESIKIGAILSLTGAGAGLGHPEQAGIDVAVEEINEAGGIDGRPIEVEIHDDGSNPDTALVAVGELMDDDVVALIGASLTASTDAVGTVTHDAGLPQVAFTGIGPEIEFDWPCTFHVLPPQSMNARAMLSFATSEQGAETIGVLHDSGYGSVVTASIEELADEFGVEIVETQQADVAATDVTTQAARVRSADPDVVFVISTNPIFFRGAREAGIEGTLVSAIGSASYEYVEGMGDFADDVVFAEFLVGEDPAPHQTEFVDAFNEMHGSLPKNFEAAGYDAVMVIVEGLRSAGGDDRAALCEAMRGPYDGVLASYDFSRDDLTGIELSSFVFSKLEDGDFTRLEFTAAAD